MKTSRNAAKTERNWIINEWKTIFTNPRRFIPLIAILFIPVLYSGTYLWAFWDPYAHLQKLPVSVVNMDKGAVSGGKTYHLGNELADRLQQDKGFDWHFVTLDEAERGLRNNQYYIMIEIPDDFSYNATTVAEERPKPLELYYKANPGYNYIASRIGQTGVEDIRSEVTRNLVKSYSENIFNNMNDLVGGLNQASVGAGDLQKGAVTLNQGTSKLLSGLHSGEPQVKQMAQGAADLHTGASKLATGAQQLHQGFAQLNAGLAQAAAGADPLAAGARQAAQGAASLSGSMASFGAGLASAAQSAASADAGASKLNGQLAAASADADKAAMAADALLAKHPELAKDADFTALQRASKLAADEAKGAAETAGLLPRSLADVSAGVSALSGGFAPLQQGAAQLASSLEPLAGGSAQASAALQQLRQGAASFFVKLGDLMDGSAQLADSSQKLAAGASGLSLSWGSLIQSAAALDDGASKLSAGSSQLSTALAAGIDKTKAIHSGQQTYEMISNPVRIVEKTENKVPNYGTGLAPYFLSLSLFVGALLLTTVFQIKETHIPPISPISWFLNKFILICGIGIVQSLLACFVALKLLGLQTHSNGYFLLFTILTSITFMSIIQFLVTAFNDPGRFIAIILLILQLTASAGTYPLELIPVLLQKMHNILPMTYSVAGFRDIITTGDLTRLTHNAEVLVLFMLLAISATISTFFVQYKKIRLS